MSPVDVQRLADLLTERDLAILRTLRAHRLATTAQLRRWHFVEQFATLTTATRSTQRVLARLEHHRLAVRLAQRIGGVRRGSESVVWQLDVAGDRLLSVLDGDHRRRYLEPARAFVSHTVAVTELAVRLTEAVRSGELEHAQFTGEPDCWRRFSGAHGRAEILKPDLTAVTAFGDYEDHWFLELDLATESPSIVARKAHVYERYANTGAYQADHSIFPVVLWIVPDEARVIALERALRRSKGLTPGIHRVVTGDRFLPTVLVGNDPAPENSSNLTERRNTP